MAPLITTSFLYPEYHPAQKFISKKAEKPCGTNLNPLILSYISDIHIGFFEYLKVNNIIKVFKLA